MTGAEALGFLVAATLIAVGVWYVRESEWLASVQEWRDGLGSSGRIVALIGALVILGAVGYGLLPHKNLQGAPCPPAFISAFAGELGSSPDSPNRFSAADDRACRSSGRQRLATLTVVAVVAVAGAAAGLYLIGQE